MDIKVYTAAAELALTMAQTLLPLLLFIVSLNDAKRMVLRVWERATGGGRCVLLGRAEVALLAMEEHTNLGQEEDTFLWAQRRRHLTSDGRRTTSSASRRTSSTSATVHLGRR